MQRRILLIAAGGARFAAELPTWAPDDVRVICTCDPRDQVDGDGHRHRRVYFVRQHLDDDEGLVFVQQELIDVRCETVTALQ